MPASMVAITILGEPIGSTIFAYFILGEGLTIWKVLGGISIFAGILIALRPTPSIPIVGSSENENLIDSSV
jgi:drug/metabolite transporter (DMT)-like permease